MARLKVAVDKLNESLGTEMRVEVDEEGRYQIMEGDAIRAKEAIEDLIAVKQAEMRLDAASQGYEDAYAKEAEAATAVEAARKKAADAYDAYQSAAEKARNGDVASAQVLNSLLDASVRADEELAQAIELQNSAGDAASYMQDQMTLNQMAVDKGADSLASWVASNQNVIASVQAGGRKVTDFTKHLDDAGVSTDKLASLSAAKATYIASAYKGTSGSVSDAFRRIESVSDETFDEIWESCRGNTSKVEQSLREINGIDLDDKEVKVTADTDDVWREIRELQQQKINIPVLTSMATAQKAAGGFARLHGSGGFITSGPTVLGSDGRGIVHIAGEDGREWVQRHADGTTSIVPIQNRRYLKPYAETIASMIGKNTSSSTYNITVNARTDADPDEIAGAIGRRIRLINMARGN